MAPKYWIMQIKQAKCVHHSCINAKSSSLGACAALLYSLQYCCELFLRCYRGQHDSTVLQAPVSALMNYFAGKKVGQHLHVHHTSTVRLRAQAYRG